MSHRLFHCFGASDSVRVDAAMAARMLRVSGTTCVPLNTHNVHEITDPRDLILGYGDATWGAVGGILNGTAVTPILNINLPTSAQEAIDRTRAAVRLSGIKRIKLEVLDRDHLRSNDAELVAVVEQLAGAGLELWPLITPNLEAARRLAELGCPMIRIQGSAIGSRRGIDARGVDAMRQILRHRRARYMLDGGIGSAEHAAGGLALGFDCFLVNSCLFGASTDPVTRLAEFRQMADAFDGEEHR